METEGKNWIIQQMFRFIHLPPLGRYMILEGTHSKHYPRLRDFETKTQFVHFVQSKPELMGPRTLN